MIESRKIEDLIPVVQVMARRFVSDCAAAGIDVLITSTYRDGESQNKLYAKGRTTPGNNPRLSKPLGDTVTSARANESKHQFRCAFDFVPIMNGKAMWNDDMSFTKCGVIAEKIGLSWSGRWKSNPEKAHCEYTGGLSLVQLQNGAVIK